MCVCFVGLRSVLSRVCLSCWVEVGLSRVCLVGSRSVYHVCVCLVGSRSVLSRVIVLLGRGRFNHVCVCFFWVEVGFITCVFVLLR